MKKQLSNEKVLYNLNNSEIIDAEAMGRSYWLGNIIIHNNYIKIEKITLPSTFSHLIINPKIAEKKYKYSGRIVLKECLLKSNNEILLKGVKHRLIHNSKINIKIKNNDTAGLDKVKELVETYFLDKK